MEKEYDELKKSWDEKAEEWHLQVGEEGDSNRIQNSDPFLWKFLGPKLKNKIVLDAGCGTGYLSRKLAMKGSIVTGIDISDKMIDIAKKIAQKKDLNCTFSVDSVENLTTIQSNYFDIIVSNYVLQDTPNIDKACNSFYRVLKENGRVIITITHPCFPQSEYTKVRDDNTVHYIWNFSYLDQKRIIDKPWGHFTSDFIFYHRPLSYYWKIFKNNGFIVSNFDEPAPKTREEFDLDEKRFFNNRMRPNSVIFELLKTL